MMRSARVERRTGETQVAATLVLDGSGSYEIATGIRFLDHMLELLARHGGVDLQLSASGDLDVDQHHTVEDIGIVLGEAFDRALGDKAGILRAGCFLMPMDEALAQAVVDFGGRSAAVVQTGVEGITVGDLDAGMVHEFFEGFGRGARCNVHVRVLYGRSAHHMLEAAFKAFARALRAACARDPERGDVLPTTKGVL